MQHETERPRLVTAVHFVGELRLLLRPRDELLRGEALRRLGRGPVDLAHDDILPPVHVDAELDPPVWFYALRGGCGRNDLGIVSCHIGGQVAASPPA